MAESAVPFPTTSGPTRVSVRSVERPADAGWTLVAGVDDPNPARVDGGGAVSPAGVDWVLDWWIGAEDRWHFPSREASVRQRRLGPGPVIETSLRVPGGDVTSTVYPASSGRHRLSVVEIRNSSKTPVTLALALRSISLDGSTGHQHRLELLDGRVIAVDAKPAVVLPRPPGQAGAGTNEASTDKDGAANTFPGRLTGGEPMSWEAPVAGPGAEAVLVYPLPHDTSLRISVLSESNPDLDVVQRLAPDQMPDAQSVQRGWASVADQASRTSFPDPGLTELTGAARARLVVEAPRLADAVVGLEPGSGVVLSGLAAAGHTQECRTPLLHLASTFPTRLPHGPTAATEVAVAVADAAQLLDDVALAESLLEPLMALVSHVEKAGTVTEGAQAKLALADLAEVAGQIDAAAHLRSEIPNQVISQAASGRLGLETIMSLAQLAAPSGRLASPVDDGQPDDSEAAARFWLASRRLLLDRPVGATRHDDDGLPLVELFPTFPSAWLGGALEIHDVPIARSRVSLAIRWHGYRPALLWETTGATLRLSCPGLDPDWSTSEATGEALLVGSPDQLPDAPAPGDSFA